MWTPSGQEVKWVTQHHQLGRPHHGEWQVILLHPQGPHTPAKSPSLATGEAVSPKQPMLCSQVKH